MLTWLSEPWPWYVTGPLLGLTVPLLLIFGNKSFGVSSSLRHICAAVGIKADYFRYDWKSKSWNLVFVGGVILGGLIAFLFLNADVLPPLSDAARTTFRSWGLALGDGLVPAELFRGGAVFSLRSLVILLVGGFLIGFGTRWANGCTSGHTIMGLSLLNPGSLVATIGFFIGGLIGAWGLLPLILSL